MKVLVIPDVHLKPWIFEAAERLMREGTAERAVCLMDIADDWDHQFDLDLYRSTYDAAIRFAKEFPDTLWCYGNHDVSYVWEQPESGYSSIAGALVRQKLEELRKALPEETPRDRLEVCYRREVQAGMTVRVEYAPRDGKHDVFIRGEDGTLYGWMEMQGR